MSLTFNAGLGVKMFLFWQRATRWEGVLEEVSILFKSLISFVSHSRWRTKISPQH